MRLHFVGLPHTEVTREWEFCAYTQKLLHMLQICDMIGYETVLYTSTKEERDTWFEDKFSAHNPDPPVFDRWDPEDVSWTEMNTRVIEEMKSTLDPGDVICIIAGRCQQAIVEAFPNNISLEWAVGYEGILNNTHHCFESRTWQHFIYGRNGVNDGRFFDTVIPNSFDIKDFAYGGVKNDYILFLGRMIPRKGLAIVEEVAKKHRVFTAGQGDMRVSGAEHLGVLKGSEKAQWVSGAKALICPTTYIEPFGGVAVEAMLSGTPVLSTDFGAFVETNIHGETGFRCNTLREFLEAAEKVGNLNSVYIRERAQSLYSLEAVAPQWKRWYDQVGTLYGRGWYE